MAYIGRDTDKISNVEVLDNITFDGSSSYTLQKGGSNFTPSSANTLLLSIDGVVQAGNFTVSGSTIDFGTAVAGTSTCDFILHYGVGLITTPADGTVTNDKISYPLAKSGATVSTFNRTTSDGTILELQKDGTKSADIGTVAGGIAFISGGVSTGTGLQLNNAANQIRPCDNTGAARDNAITLGDTTRRFADLYLGGGLYVGGTGTANKLDDYEEGTWSPSITTGTANFGTSYYTKIGRQVTISFNVENLSDNTTGSSLEIGNLPFTNIGTFEFSGSCHGERVSTIFQALVPFLVHSTNKVKFRVPGGTTNFITLNHDDVNDAFDFAMRVTMTYFTD
jgi:hypothetical protein